MAWVISYLNQLSSSDYEAYLVQLWSLESKTFSVFVATYVSLSGCKHLKETVFIGFLYFVRNVLIHISL